MWKKFLLWLLKYVPGIATTIMEQKMKDEAAKAAGKTRGA